MNLSAKDPESIRAFLKRRQFESGAILAGVFLFFVGATSFIAYLLFDSLIVPMLLGDGLAVVIVYYVYLYYSRQPLRIRCKKCGGSIECTTPWICGHCSHENWNVDEFPFIYRCEECSTPPKSYICHHCEKSNRDEGKTVQKPSDQKKSSEKPGEKKPSKETHIFFSEDRDTSNPARRITEERLKTKQRKESEMAAQRDFEEKKRGLQQKHDLTKTKVDSAQLDLALAQAKTLIKAAKKGASEIPVSTAGNIYVDAFKEIMPHKQRLDEAVNILRREAEAAFPKGSLALKKRHNEIDAFYAEEFAKLTKNPTRK